MKRNGFLILFLLVGLLSGLGFHARDKKIPIKYSALTNAKTNLQKWSTRLSQSNKKVLVRTKKEVKQSSKEIQKIAEIKTKLESKKLDKIVIEKLKTLDFQKMEIDRVARRSSAVRRRSIIKPLVLELKSYDEKEENREIEFQKPIKKRIDVIEEEATLFKTKKIKSNSKKRKAKQVQEIASAEIVKLNKVVVKIEEPFKVSSLLNNVRIHGQKNFEQFLEIEGKKEIARIEQGEKKEISKKEVAKVEDVEEKRIATNYTVKAPAIELSIQKEEKTAIVDTVSQSSVKKVEEKTIQPNVVAAITDHTTNTISATVKEVIEREMSMPVSTEKHQLYAAVDTQLSDNIKGALNSNEDIQRSGIVEYSPCSSIETAFFSRVDVFGYSGGSLGKRNSRISNFEFIPLFNEYDEEDRKKDENGLIAFCKDLNDGSSLLGGYIKREGYVDSGLLVSFNETHRQINVPLIEKEYFNNLTSEYSIDERMGAILIEKYDGIDDVAIDSREAVRLELNGNLELVNEESERSEFVLFLNVEPRNILITYTFERGPFVEKLVYVQPHSVFYDEPIVEEEETQYLILNQRNIAGIVSTELDIIGKDLKYFNRNIFGKKVGLNRFKMVRPRTLAKMRNYLELGHLGKVVYAGYGDNHTIEMPADEFINYSLDKLGVSAEMDQQCVVQINLRKDKTIQESIIDAHNVSGPLYSKQYYFDVNGVYYENEWSAQTSKIFIAAELTTLGPGVVATGSVSVKLKYADGTVDYLQTFCSDKTYLVEQL